MDDQIVTTPQQPNNNPLPQEPHVSVQQKGRLNSLIKFVLFIIIVILCVGGVYYWQHKKVNNLATQLSSSNTHITSLNKQLAGLQVEKSSTGSSASTTTTKVWSFDGYYTLNYPASWNVGEYVGADESSGQFPFVYFTPNNSPSGANPQLISVWISTASSASTNLFNQEYSTQVSNGNKPSKTTINGYNTFSYQVVQTAKNPPAASGIQTDDYYVLEDGSESDVTLTFDFTVSKTGTAYGTAYNASSLSTSFTNLVNTTKFQSLHS
jgi:cell division protein FtsL